MLPACLAANSRPLMDAPPFHNQSLVGFAFELFGVCGQQDEAAVSSSPANV